MTSPPHLHSFCHNFIWAPNNSHHTMTMKQYMTIAALCLIANVGTFAFLSQAPTGKHSVSLFAKNKGRQLNLPKPLPTGPPAKDIR